MRHATERCSTAGARDGGAGTGDAAQSGGESGRNRAEVTSGSPALPPKGQVQWERIKEPPPAPHAPHATHATRGVVCVEDTGETVSRGGERVVRKSGSERER